MNGAKKILNSILQNINTKIINVLEVVYNDNLTQVLNLIFYLLMYIILFSIELFKMYKHSFK